MTAKINALVVTVIVVILLLITIYYKIKSDKKRRSSVIPDYETIKPTGKKSFLATTPSSILAILTLFAATIVLFGIGEGLGSILKGNTSDVLAYIAQGVVITIGCYFIVKQNPRSAWYVPVISNLTGIIAAIVESGFWTHTSWWGPVCGVWVLSIISSIIGAQVGRRRILSENS